MSKFWNDENTATAKGMYAELGNEGVDEIVKAVKAKNRKSVIGKLASEKVYVAPEKPARKTPVDEGPTKDEILAAIAAKGFDVSGGKGATKDFLKRVEAVV